MHVAFRFVVSQMDLLFLLIGDYICFPFFSRFLNRAMQSFDATVVVPTNFVLFTISAIISGKLLFLKSIFIQGHPI